MKHGLMLFALILAWLTVGAVLVWGCPARGEVSDTELGAAIGRLAPWMNDSTRGTWARRIVAQDARWRIGDPILLAAVVRKESSFNAKTAGDWSEDGTTRRRITKRGPAGEYGAMQIHPNSGWRAYPVAGCHDPERPGLYALTPACAFAIGVRMFAHLKQQCGGSYWVAVASYKYGHCQTERSARREKAARNARVYYCEALGDYAECDRRWPQ